MPLNTISMGQTKTPTKTNRVWSRLGPRSFQPWRGEIHQLGGRRRLRSQGSRQPKPGSVWFTQGGLGPCPLQALPGVVGWHISPTLPLRGGGVECALQHAWRAQRAGESTGPSKRPVCRGHVQARAVALEGRQRLLAGVAWAKAGRQKARSSPLSLSPFPGLLSY